VKTQRFLISAVVVGLISIACMQQVAKDTKAPVISKEELMTIMDRPDVIILDVRVGNAWKAADRKIKGAVREDPEKDVKGWAGGYLKDKTLVFYCN
jgi:rhodanese-related sulfurtransferase